MPLSALGLMQVSDSLVDYVKLQREREGRKLKLIGISLQMNSKLTVQSYLIKGQNYRSKACVEPRFSHWMRHIIRNTKFRRILFPQIRCGSLITWE
jgi:predicted restriction endonuclease